MYLISSRVPYQTAKELEMLADLTGKTLSELTRKALTSYLARIPGRKGA